MLVKEERKLAGATRACWEDKSAPASFTEESEELQTQSYSREQQNMLLLQLLEML